VLISKTWTWLNSGSLGTLSCNLNLTLIQLEVCSVAVSSLSRTHLGHFVTVSIATYPSNTILEGGESGMALQAASASGPSGHVQIVEFLLQRVAGKPQCSR
jgi:hypothetical protein